MGPVFYLVQSKEALRLISATPLGNWPHEFALAPSPGKGGCALDRRLCLQRLPPSAEACGARTWRGDVPLGQLWPLGH